MKKILAPILMILFMISILSGCRDKKEPPVRYTTEILISQEAFPENFTWYACLEAPTAGTAIFEIASYSTYATLDTVNISQTAQRDYRGILDANAPFHDTFLDKIAFFFDRELEKQKHNHMLKVLGMSSEEFDQKIGTYVDMNDFHYYPDCVIGIIYPLILQGEEEQIVDAEYAGKNIFVDFNYETSVVIPYTDDELIAENDGLYSTNYIGRIGNRYYLPYGYYDITDRKLCPYKDESDLPPFKGLPEVENPYDLLQLIQNDADAAAHISEHYYIDSYVLLDDRYYAILKRGNRYYGNGLDGYEGEDVFLITVNAIKGNILYLQKFHIENYWGYQYKLYSLGKDGVLYDVMVS